MRLLFYRSGRWASFLQRHFLRFFVTISARADRDNHTCSVTEPQKVPNAGTIEVTLVLKLNQGFGSFGSSKRTVCTTILLYKWSDCVPHNTPPVWPGLYPKDVSFKPNFYRCFSSHCERSFNTSLRFISFIISCRPPA
jgi:hypothetical protein